MLELFKYITILILTLLLATSCSSYDKKNSTSISTEESKAFNSKVNDTITISNPDEEYEIIIIEQGFEFWLNSIARPRNYYGQSYLEGRNQLYVQAWNARVGNMAFNQNLYEMRIDYNPNIDYGYEVNYKLYNYFIYFQRKYNQQLTGFIPRI